jgi:hypothetical protein
MVEVDRDPEVLRPVLRGQVVVGFVKAVSGVRAVRLNLVFVQRVQVHS